jgi:hypothetical protein
MRKNQAISHRHIIRQVEHARNMRWRYLHDAIMHSRGRCYWINRGHDPRQFDYWLYRDLENYRKYSFPLE